MFLNETKTLDKDGGMLSFCMVRADLRLLRAGVSQMRWQVGWTSDSPELLMHLDDMALKIYYQAGLHMQLHILTSKGKKKKVQLTADKLQRLKVTVTYYNKDKLEDPTCLETLLKLPILQSRGILILSDEGQEAGK